MRRILAIGDFHIPSRARAVPQEVREFVEREKFDFVVCTGDLTDASVLRWLESLEGELVVVAGNMDYLDLPWEAKFEAEGLTFGLNHGSRVYPRGDTAQLAAIAGKMGADVLFTGHTHFPFAETVGRVAIVNPGSATGVWGGDPRATETPSFAVVEVSGRSLTVAIYELLGGKLSVKEKRFAL